LARRERAFTCPAGHTYDIARNGYINLLQPQDRRSLSAGDSREAVLARARLHAAGVGRTLIDAVLRRVRSLAIQRDDARLAIADLGSGTGDALAVIAQAAPIGAIGVDLSAAAAEHAARRFPGVTWIVANADRRLPFTDRSLDVVLSLHARRNATECARVLVPGGRLIAAVPAPHDLLELRTIVQGAAAPRDRTESLIAEHAARFALEHREIVQETVTLSRELVVDLLTITYRGARMSEQPKVASLGAMSITCASELVVLRLVS
jgi:23S rRNA (guanine745-N1)-methyltransferase